MSGPFREAQPESSAAPSQNGSAKRESTLQLLPLTAGPINYLNAI